MKGVRLESKASNIKFKHVGNRVLTKTTRRSVMSAHEGGQEPTRFPDEMDPHEMSDEEWREKIDLRISKLSLMEDTRMSRFTHHQLLLV